VPIPTYPELSQSVFCVHTDSSQLLIFQRARFVSASSTPTFSILFLHNFEALRGKGGQAREQGAQEDVARTKAKNDTVVISCQYLSIAICINLPIQLVKIATGWPSMLLGSFHPKRLVFRHVRVHLRWIPLDDPISFHIAVATLVAVNSFVHVGSPVSGGIRRKRSKVLRSPLRDGIGWTQGKACHVMATNEPSAPSAPAPAQVCSHFVHMAQIAGSPNFQLGSQSCIEIWTCWRPSGHHLDTISTYLHYLSFQNQERSP